MDADKQTPPSISKLQNAAKIPDAAAVSTLVCYSGAMSHHVAFY